MRSDFVLFSASDDAVSGEVLGAILADHGDGGSRHAPRGDGLADEALRVGGALAAGGGRSKRPQAKRAAEHRFTIGKPRRGRNPASRDRAGNVSGQDEFS
jgi:hypothetical protein